jgi:hypothetical protein
MSHSSNIYAIRNYATFWSARIQHSSYKQCNSAYSLSSVVVQGRDDLRSIQCMYSCVWIRQSIIIICTMFIQQWISSL